MVNKCISTAVTCVIALGFYKPVTATKLRSYFPWRKITGQQTHYRCICIDNEKPQTTTYNYMVLPNQQINQWECLELTKQFCLFLIFILPALEVSFLCLRFLDIKMSWNTVLTLKWTVPLHFFHRGRKFCPYSAKFRLYAKVHAQHIERGDTASIAPRKK